MAVCIWRRVIGLRLRQLGNAGGDIRLRLRDIGLRLPDIGLQIGGILLDDDLAGANDLPFAEVDGDDPSCGPRRNLHIRQRLNAAGHGNCRGNRAGLHGRDLHRDAAAGIADAGFMLAACRVLLFAAARAGQRPSE